MLSKRGQLIGSETTSWLHCLSLETRHITECARRHGFMCMHCLLVWWAEKKKLHLLCLVLYSLFTSAPTIYFATVKYLAHNIYWSQLFKVYLGKACCVATSPYSFRYSIFSNTQISEPNRPQNNVWTLIFTRCIAMVSSVTLLVLDRCFTVEQDTEVKQQFKGVYTCKM